MALQAIRKFSIAHPESGERWDFDQGDTIPEAAQRALPAGRLESLRNSRHVLDIGEDIGAGIKDLVDTVAELAEAVADLTERMSEVEAAATEPAKTTTERKAA